jgi:GDP-L-fucose synthase
MTILVAGASGLAGSAIVREFTRLNKEVVGISSKDLNLLDRNATFQYFHKLKPSVVIDAAAKVGGIKANNSHPVEFLSNNILIQTNLMNAAHDVNVDRFIFLGSNCVYPKYCPQPIKEEYLMTGELEPTNSAYAIAKLAGLELIKSYRKEYGHSWISVMPINLYGPNDNFDLESGHLFAALIRKFTDAVINRRETVTVWGTGKPRREFLHVDDLARAIVICLEKYDSDMHINIGTGTDLTIKALVEKISAISGFKGRVEWDESREDGTLQKVLDVQKITNLGWKPSISLEDGIRSTINWYLENNQIGIQ